MTLRVKLIILLFLTLSTLPRFAFSNIVDINGSLANYYTLRATGSNKDQNLTTIFTLNGGDGFSDRFTAAIQAGGIFDLDGKHSGTPLSDIYDTFGYKAIPRIYYAYLDAKDLGPIYKMRLGRQYNYEFESLQFDGGSFESDPGYPVSLKVYGGVPVHQFEDQWGHDSGDWLAGGALDMRLASQLKGRIDFVHIKDDGSGYGIARGDRADNLFGLSLWWDINKYFEVSSRFTSFFDQVKDAQFSTLLKWGEKDFSLRYNFYTLINAYSFRVADLDGFGIAGAYEPYYESSLSIYKGFLSRFAVDGGLSIRRLVEKQIANAFNHGFERIYISLSAYDIPIKDMSMTLTEDYYHGEDNTLKNNSHGTSFYLTKGFFEKKLELSFGTAFYFYRYNVLNGDESSNVQTYFLETGWKIIKALKAKIKYEFEKNEFDNFHTLNAGVTWNF